MEFSEYFQFPFVLHEKYEKSLKCITMASWPQYLDGNIHDLQILTKLKYLLSTPLTR